MGFDFSDFAARYGLRAEPIIVTDSNLNIKYVNRFAANLSVLQLNGDFLKKNLSPAAMQRVQRLRRGKKDIVFTQYFGKKYKERFKIKAMWDGNEHIVFTLFRPHGYHSEPPLRELMSQDMINASQQQILDVAARLGQVQTSDPAIKEIAALAEQAALIAMRCARREQYKTQELICYAYHLPSLINFFLTPCEEYLKETGHDHKLHYRKLTGEGVFKCDGQIFGYILYCLISTVMYHTEGDVTLHYTEYPNGARLDILSGKDRPIIVSDRDPQASYTVCDSLNLSVAYVLMEKLQGELDARWLCDGGLMFSLYVPTAYVDGALKERISYIVKESDQMLKVEFSILQETKGEYL